MEAIKINVDPKQKASKFVEKKNLVIYSAMKISGVYDLVVAETIKEDDGEGRRIEWGCCETPFGKGFLAKLGDHICSFSFIGDNSKETELKLLKHRWPLAEINQKPSDLDHIVKFVLNDDSSEIQSLKILLKGSRFQLAVWKQLLKIKRGETVSYQEVANRLGRPDSVRAVGTAIGRNEMAVIIPCHRVVSASGAIGQYRWGTERKKCLLGYEHAIFNK